MSSIDLVILGIVLEKPQSAYDIQKDVEYHNLSRWTKISIPSIYKKVLQLKEKGYLQSKAIKGNKFLKRLFMLLQMKVRHILNSLWILTLISRFLSCLILMWLLPT